MKGIYSYHHYLYREDIKYENHMFKSSKIFYVTLFLAMIYYDITIEKKSDWRLLMTYDFTSFSRYFSHIRTTGG